MKESFFCQIEKVSICHIDPSINQVPKAHFIHQERELRIASYDLMWPWEFKCTTVFS